MSNADFEVVQTGELIARGVLAIGDGYRARSSELAEHGLPFARAGDVAQGRFELDGAERFPRALLHKVGEKLSRPGDVVFTSKGTVGRFAFVTASTPRFVFSPQLCYWRSLDDTRLDPRWLYYWMNGPEFWAQASGVKGQTDMADYVSLSDQRRMSLTLPPIGDQRAIASVLALLDDKIELNRQLSQTAEGLARALFRAWFIDFEPVRAKAAGASSFPSMPQAVFDELPSVMIQAGEGAAPEGWPLRPLGEVLQLNPTRRLVKGVVAPYLDMAQMPTRGHAPEAWTERAAGSGARFINGDTLVARITPCLENGKTAFVDFLGEGQVAWGSTEFIVLRPSPPMPEVYAYLLARSTGFRTFAIQHMTGSSGRQRVPVDSLGQFRIAQAPPAVLAALGLLVQPLFERIQQAGRESRALRALRDVLLPRLLNGTIRARDSAP